MSAIRINGKSFLPLLDKTELDTIIRRLADEINHDYADKKPVFLVTLNGAFMFAADLIRQFRGDCEIAFVRMKSYEGMTSAGSAVQVMGVSLPLEGKDVIIVEDLVETGITIRDLLELLKATHPKSVRLAIMLLKPHLLKVRDLPIHYVGREVGNEFLVGFGLDYDEQGRNLPEIYKCVD